MRCLSTYAMHYAIVCQFLVTYVIHAIWKIYHVSRTVISKAYNFKIIHLNVNILEFIYQHSINNHHQASQSKASKDSWVLTTNCGIRDAHKAVHTYIHHRPQNMPYSSHTSGPTRPWDSLEPQSQNLYKICTEISPKIQTRQINNLTMAIPRNRP